MLTKETIDKARAEARNYLAAAGIVLTPSESETIEVADFGLSDLDIWGLELVTYINTERVCAKDLVLFPRQTCPEHRHPPIGDDPGKEETFRCRQGLAFVYLPGPATPNVAAVLPEGYETQLTVFAQHVLHPGEQITIPPDTLHWFQSGPDGAVVSEFSTRSRDEADIFTDPAIVRSTQVAG